MFRVITAGLRAHAARLVASTIAIVIAVGFVVATLTIGATTRSTVLEAVGARYVSADVVVTGIQDPAGLDADVAGLPGVGAVDLATSTSVQAVVPGRSGAQFLLVDSVAEDPALRWQQLAEGALPDRPGEVAVSERVGADVGDVLTVATYDEEGREDASQATVVGVVDLGGDPSAGINGRAFVTPEQVAAWGGLGPSELRIAAADGTDPDSLVADVRAALADRDVEVRTGEEQAEQEAASVTGDAEILTTVLLVFGAVALLVAGLVIANTFAVLLAQRTRELALLRCIGATSRQVRRSVLAEAAATGLGASVLGVGAGIGLAVLASALVGTDSPVPLAGVEVPLSAVVLGLVVGTGTTLLAALAPARAATRIAPLAALRPLDPAPLRSRGGLLRLAAGLLLLVPGVLLMAGGVVGGEILFSVGGGALSFLGVVLLAQRAVPPVVAAAGRLVRSGGVTARLAGGNATRNPRRTAATATALLIGVTLTTAMVVGAASTRATAQAELTAQYPTDVVVTGNTEDGVPASLAERLAAVDGVRAAAGLQAGGVTGPDGYEGWTLGVDPAAAAGVLRSTGDLPLPAEGTAVLPWWTVEGWGVEDGGRVTLTGDDGPRTFTVALGDTDYPLLTVGDLTALDPDAVADTVWLRLDDGVDPAAVVDEVTDVAGSIVPTAAVTGLASERAALDEVLDVLLLVVTGLLGVAVLIALIGVGNTLALSVVERRQENGLLRALGLTRGQVRGLLAWEATLVAGVAAVLGVVLGAGYGLVGVASLLGDQGELVLSFPWLQVGAIVVVATVAGLLASVLPARRAARTPPVAALAA
ncbi:ABC transporter permease [Blastococcus sp. TF02A-26]|uniref:ABC transporter permease n=1 Tax=Blastococcus sp. TF02A-26 TaxID=2250577 RepID=UPI001F2D8767|nr:ABC transporter permease [Blastococcus sp. TF02A-26]